MNGVPPALTDERSFTDVVRDKRSEHQVLYEDVRALVNETHPLFRRCSRPCVKIILMCDIATKHRSFIVRKNLKVHETLHRKMVEFKNELDAQIHTTGVASPERRISLPSPT